MRRLKIAFLVHVYGRHMGHSRYVAELAERFAREHEVHVFTHRVEAVPPEGVRFHHVPAWPLRSLTLILSFVLPATLLLRGRFDVIHAQGLCGLRQDVTTAHMCQRGFFAAIERLGGRLTLAQRIARALLVPLERLTYRERLSPEVIAVSEASRRDLATHYGRRKGVTVVYHGVDLERFHPRERAAWRAPVRAEIGLCEDELTALYVGDLRKGAGPALRALARVPGVRLVFVSPSAEGPWRELAGRLGVGDRALFLPASRTIERHFAAADVFLFPTAHDAFGLVIAEAMAAGLPVVTSRAAGAAELIEPGVDGLLVEDPGDDREIAAALARLVEDPSLRARLGEAARKKAERFSWDRAAERTMVVYQRIINRRKVLRERTAIHDA